VAWCIFSKGVVTLRVGVLAARLFLPEPTGNLLSALVMKKIILSLACGSAILCGCNKSNTETDAKIGALSQKLDLISSNQGIVITNEFVLFNEMAMLKSQVTNLPSLTQIDALNYYYFTNLNQGVVLIMRMCQLNSRFGSDAFSNNLIALNETEDIKASLNRLEINQSALLGEIAGRTVGIESLLTNGTTLDIGYTRLKVEDMGHDLDQIKMRLGIN
jgi:hypothetical protein